MRSRRHESRGNGKIQAVIALIVVGLAVHSGMQYIPFKIKTAELRGFIQDSLSRQADYRTQQAVRQAVVDLLAQSATFELPEDLVRRQTSRELQRRVSWGGGPLPLRGMPVRGRGRRRG